MKINVEKLTDVSLVRRACEFTSRKPSKITLDKIYQCEHSPLRTQMFWIEMRDIPTFVSVHLVRHKFGVEHFVESNRDDTKKDSGIVDRNTLVNHAMLINAQALINMARKRLCSKTHTSTLLVMVLICRGVKIVDKDLAEYLVPECVYRGGCNELKSCKR